LLLIITSPFFIITAIAIKAYDGGPVFYSQERLTIGGRIFKVHKFRSMIVDAEKNGKAQLASKDDDRITPVGKFIRKIRLDELPQLINIFMGDMSFVGPRPERPELAAKYEKTMPEFKYRLKVKAGLTGYAQVMGKYNTTPYDKLKMDLMYIERQSFWEDMKIIIDTIKICFVPDATEGVSDTGPIETKRERIGDEQEKDPKKKYKNKVKV
ncbi:MAG: sugar transferase, partial [Hominimerdicola sp.]